MLTKAKALYQVRLILDYLPDEEYKLIPQETIDYIEENFEYDENFTIDPKIPLENQNIDDKAYEVLDKIVKSVESTKLLIKTKNNSESDEDIQKVKENNNDIEIENIRLNNLVELLKKENSKIPKAKELLEEYKEALKQKDNEIAKLKECNQNLYKYIQRVPKFLRKIFMRSEEIKLLDTNNY